MPGELNTLREASSDQENLEWFDGDSCKGSKAAWVDLGPAVPETNCASARGEGSSTCDGLAGDWDDP